MRALLADDGSAGAAGRTADSTFCVGDAAAEIIAEGASWDADLSVRGSCGVRPF